MANITETDDWASGVYQYAIGDVLDGGPESSETLPIRQLANRSLYQRLRNITPWDVALANAVGYPAGSCVMHAGVSWRSKVLNSVEPGTDALKWERWAFSESELLDILADINVNIQHVINNTYLGPAPVKQRTFTPLVTLPDMPFINTDYTVKQLVFTGFRRARFLAHCAFKNESNAGSARVTVELKVNGANIFGGHYLGAAVPAATASGNTQIPITISDIVTNLDPAVQYTVALIARKGDALGPILVQDGYLEAELYA